MKVAVVSESGGGGESGSTYLQEANERDHCVASACTKIEGWTFLYHPPQK